MLLALSIIGLLVQAQAPSIKVTVDSARHEVVLEAGRFDVPAHHGSATAGHGEHRPLLLGFRWPVTGWLRGFAVEVTDASGRPLPPTLLHHLNVVNFERRQLIHPAFERLIALGRETGDVNLPRGVGVPIEEQSRLALLVAWANPGHEDVNDVALRLRIKWLPATTSPAPQSVLILAADADFAAGTSDAYDLVSGPSERTFEFVVPASGRILGVGGHLHDYGKVLRLEEAATGRVLFELIPRLDRAGRLVGLPTLLPGVMGDGIRLRAGRCYRMVARYDNPTGRTIENGAMALIVGIMAPDRIEDWPLATGPDLLPDARGLALLDGHGLEFGGDGWQLTPVSASRPPGCGRLNPAD